MDRRRYGDHGRHVGLPVKRWALAALVCLTAASASAQQFLSAPTTSDVYPFGAVTQFSCSLNAIAASLTQCQAAPGAGLKLYITSLHVQSTTTTSGTYAVQTGTGTNCGTGTAPLFPSSSTSNRFNAPPTTAGMADLTFPVPLSAAANTAICLVGVATNTISAQITGYIAP